MSFIKYYLQYLKENVYWFGVCIALILIIISIIGMII